MTDPRPRRAVLLAADGAVERVLADPPARFLYRSLGQLAAEHPGRVVRGDWLCPRRGWVPFCWAGGYVPDHLEPCYRERPRGSDKKRRVR